ncbi:lipopolysaccharide biosynthesis glycosyltransferase [Ligilactobacillus salitolerans]|uniref:Lipopolysaccharide biosynthesis glycosyltransferase n=1 Tax=Ligilactobacillus salitolerans TaxID=1808352 RepID=A0A401IRT0_9LACO|nr:glycosyltransferase family 8 protein [Ligilactobacillus salitolerans]GBG94226.1 lipopolysaccharide biosynthesis glycosyltransferase [Ligilactobacillus salitolerans]
MNLLFAINDSFVDQMLTVVYSILENSQPAQITMYVIQDQELAQTEKIAAFCRFYDVDYQPVLVSDEEFADAKITDRYPHTIYYRLLAQKYLPQELDKILYLDADLLCINDITPLYSTDLGDYLYAACSHSRLTNVTDVVNKVRLGNEDAEAYYNSGVLLMNLSAIRAQVEPQDIFDFITKNKFNLLLPDQDILNGLYGHQILALPDELWNFDARKNRTYEMLSMGQWDLNWVMDHTGILHFCGRDKPWRSGYFGRYSALYKHYQHRALRNLTERNVQPAAQLDPTPAVDHGQS